MGESHEGEMLVEEKGRGKGKIEGNEKREREC